MTKYFAGTWESVSPGINGNMYGKLTNDKARVMIQYTGQYAHGMQRVIDFTIEDEKASTTAPMTAVPFKSFTFVTTSQNISLEATTKTDQEIIGTYKTRNPNDNGTFRMDRTTSLAISNVMFVDKAADHQCVIA
jgi:hypothetical protein